VQMKKKWIWMILAAGLLFASCRQEIPGNLPGNTITPTGHETSVSTPGETADAEPTLGPTVVPNVTDFPAVSTVPTPTQALEPTDVPEPTRAPEPTGEIAPTETPEQSGLPLPSQNSMPDVELLVNRGWQRAVSIDGAYEVIFPELFRGSSLEKTDRELTVLYTDPSDERARFRISYRMQTTLEEFLSDMSLPEGTFVFDEQEENRVYGIWQEEERVYRGILIECRYAKTLLGSAFEGEEWIPGVMEVVFSYPLEMQGAYETTGYEFYVIDLGRE